MPDQLTLGHIAQIAQKHGLPPTLVCAVIEQESSWNPKATRYEPAFYERYVPAALHASPEGKGRATSWGPMQVMGQTAREHDYEGPFPLLLNFDAGVEIGCTVLAHKLKIAHGDVHQGLLYWNGGGNKAYPDQVIAREAKYQAAYDSFNQSDTRKISA